VIDQQAEARELVCAPDVLVGRIAFAVDAAQDTT
jgi:hypothetical protein